MSKTNMWRKRLDAGQNEKERKRLAKIKLIPCEYFVWKGKCRFGENCRFSHAYTNKRQMTPTATTEILSTCTSPRADNSQILRRECGRERGRGGYPRGGSGNGRRDYNSNNRQGWGQPGRKANNDTSDSPGDGNTQVEHADSSKGHEQRGDQRNNPWSGHGNSHYKNEQHVNECKKKDIPIPEAKKNDEDTQESVGAANLELKGGDIGSPPENRQRKRAKFWSNSNRFKTDNSDSNSNVSAEKDSFGYRGNTQGVRGGHHGSFTDRDKDKRNLRTPSPDIDWNRSYAELTHRGHNLGPHRGFGKSPCGSIRNYSQDDLGKDFPATEQLDSARSDNSSGSLSDGLDPGPGRVYSRYNGIPFDGSDSPRFDSFEYEFIEGNENESCDEYTGKQLIFNRSDDSERNLGSSLVTPPGCANRPKCEDLKEIDSKKTSGQGNADNKGTEKGPGDIKDVILDLNRRIEMRRALENSESKLPGTVDSQISEETNHQEIQKQGDSDSQEIDNETNGSKNNEKIQNPETDKKEIVDTQGTETGSGEFDSILLDLNRRLELRRASLKNCESELPVTVDSQIRQDVDNKADNNCQEIVKENNQDISNDEIENQKISIQSDDEIKNQEISKKSNEEIEIQEIRKKSREETEIQEISKKSNDEIEIQEISKKSREETEIQEISKKSNDETEIQEISKKSREETEIQEISKKSNDEIENPEIRSQSNDENEGDETLTPEELRDAKRRLEFRRLFFDHVNKQSEEKFNQGQGQDECDNTEKKNPKYETYHNGGDGVGSGMGGFGRGNSNVRGRGFPRGRGNYHDVNGSFPQRGGRSRGQSRGWIHRGRGRPWPSSGQTRGGHHFGQYVDESFTPPGPNTKPQQVFESSQSKSKDSTVSEDRLFQDIFDDREKQINHLMAYMKKWHEEQRWPLVPYYPIEDKGLLQGFEVNYTQEYVEDLASRNRGVLPKDIAHEIRKRQAIIRTLATDRESASMALDKISPDPDETAVRRYDPAWTPDGPAYGPPEFLFSKGPPMPPNLSPPRPDLFPYKWDNRNTQEHEEGMIYIEWNTPFSPELFDTDSSGESDSDDSDDIYYTAQESSDEEIIKEEVRSQTSQNDEKIVTEELEIFEDADSSPQVADPPKDGGKFIYISYGYEYLDHRKE